MFSTVVAMVVKLLLIMAVLPNPLFAQMDEDYLGNEILERCYRHPSYENGLLYINGQENPTASSLENFVNLVDKFELVNPDLNLKDVLFILLENFTTENMEYTGSNGNGRLNIVNPPAKINNANIKYFWETKSRSNMVNHINPFDDNEMCNLFFMLSHTMNSTALRNIDSSETTDPDLRPDSNHIRRYFPREQGVVSINGSKTQAIALGRVLIGLHFGLDDTEIRGLHSFVKEDYRKFLENDKVLPLYVLTIADQLVIANEEINPENNNGYFQKNGEWKCVQKPKVIANTEELDDICPLTYVLPQENLHLHYSYSSIRGGIDGLILGNIIRSIHDKEPELKLSQVLKTYYSPNGIRENSEAPRSGQPISFCNRLEGINSFNEILKTQIEVCFALISKTLRKTEMTVEAKRPYEHYNAEVRDILALDEGLNEICKRKIEKPDDYSSFPSESSSDIVVVLDTANKNALPTQQLIIGYLAKIIDMRYRGSSLTVFLDQKNETDGSGLKAILQQSFSSAFTACYINQYEIPEGTLSGIEKEFVIDAVTQTLHDMKKNDENLNGAKSKVVIYFNFIDEGQLSYKPFRALRNFFTEHPDVAVLAVGNDKDVLKLYAQNNEQNTILVPNNEPFKIASTLASKIQEVPSKLQYKECKTGSNEKNAVYRGLVTPGTTQRWSMNPDYFHKSYTTKVMFEANRGDITVCHSRATPNPEVGVKNCKTTSLSERSVSFVNTNPCKGVQMRSCSRFYFTVIVKEDADDSESNSGREIYYCRDTDDAQCKTLNQIPFTISHEGIRCSACSKIMSSPLILLAVCIITYFMKFSS